MSFYPVGNAVHRLTYLLSDTIILGLSTRQVTLVRVFVLPARLRCRKGLSPRQVACDVTCRVESPLVTWTAGQIFFCGDLSCQVERTLTT